MADKRFTKKDLKLVWDKARKHEADELEFDCAGYDTAFDCWFELHSGLCKQIINQKD